ncbi:deoxynucleotide monophosphate kinase family protein [Streptomyces eurythermus]
MNIGIIGRARSGKDTAGAWFVEQRGYRRVALADPLKEAALRLDPIIMRDSWVDHGGDRQEHWEIVRLAEIVEDEGWEGAKSYPEIRRTLQELGAAMRSLDEDFWLRQALKKTQEANDAGTPVVITDVRYRNEAESLKRAGFHLIYIERPGVPHLDHESEGALGPEAARYLVRNDGTVDELHAQLSLIWEDIHALESARFACKF